MKRLQKTLKLLLCLCIAVMALPMTALAGMSNNGVMAGTGTWGLDIDNNQNGIIISGNYTEIVNNNGGLIVGGNFTNPIVDNGTGRYGLKLSLTDVTVDAGVNIYEYNSIKYGVMPYNTDFTFTLSPDSANGYLLPKTIAIIKAGAELSPETDYSYNPETGEVIISAGVINYPLELKAMGKVVEVGIDIEKNFPDELFRQYIMDNFDKNKSGVLTADEIQEIKTIKLGLNPPTNGIESLKGIELFPQLEELYCLDMTKLSDVDVSGNKALRWLSVEGSRGISDINIEQNTELEYLNCGYTSVTSLDLISNKKLKQLYINATEIDSLNLSENSKLEVLNCFRASKMTSIDLNNNPLVNYLEIGGTGITEIDTSKLPLLASFFCSDTQITSLDISQNLKLVSFECSNNKLGFLNLGKQSINNVLFRLDRSATIETVISEKTFDITEKFKGIDVGKIKVISGGKLNGSIISDYSVDEPLIYEYDCGTNNSDKIILTVTLNFAKSESSISIDKSLGKIYDGKPVALNKEDLTITGSKGAVSFSWEKFDGTKWMAIASAPSEVGVYRVTAHLAEDDCCKGADSESQEFTIKEQEKDKPQDKPKDDNANKDKKQSKAVQTGDVSMTGMLILFSILSGAVICFLGRRRNFMK